MVPGPAITSPADFCAAMAEVPRLIPLPVSPAESAPPEPGTSRRTGEFDATNNQRRTSRTSSAPARGSARPAPSRMDQRAATSREGGLSTKRVLIGAMAVVLFVAVVVGAWSFGSMMNSGTDGEADPSVSATEDTPDDADLNVLDITGSDGFDPLGDHSEHGQNAPLAHDGDPGTAWNTEGYNDPMGTEKSGVGLILDLGASQEVHEVDLTLPQQDYGVQIRVGDSDSVSDDASLDANLPAAWEGQVSGEQTITLDEAATGQFVLIWFTDLPSDDGRFRGTINEVEVRGT